MSKANILFVLFAKANNLQAEQSHEYIAFHSDDSQTVHHTTSEEKCTPASAKNRGSCNTSTITH